MFSKLKSDEPTKKIIFNQPKSSGEIPSIIGSGTLVKGNMNCPSEIQIDGKVEGNLQCRKASISESGSVLGSIHAHEVVVRGSIKGNVYAQKVLLTSKSHLEGDIHHEELSVELGAFIEGQCQHTPFEGEGMDLRHGENNTNGKVGQKKEAKVPEQTLSNLTLGAKKTLEKKDRL